MKIVIPRYEQYDIANLPARCWPITNSERMGSVCPRQYLFRYIEGLSTTVDAPPLRYGTAWHLVMEQIFQWWMDTDSLCPDRVVAAAIDQVRNEWIGQANKGLIEMDEVTKDIERLTRGIEGWVHTYSLEPFEDYKVVGVECALARPIINPATGAAFRPKMPYIREGDSLRMARTGEAAKGRENVRWKQWPCYQVGKLDYVLQHRRTGAIWAGDHKTSARPSSYLNGMTVDPQMPGYLWLLDYNIRMGSFPGVPYLDSPVVGFMYDVANSSYQNDPAVLKNGTISTAKNRKIPSWRFRNTVCGLGIKMDDRPEYKAYYQHCVDSVDSSIYARDFMTVGRAERDRYEREIFGEARRLARLRRDAAVSPSAEHTYQTHPRVPICRLPGSGCSYKGPCINDGPMVRSDFVVKDGIRWELETRKNIDNQQQNTKGDLGW